ncbi:3-dehydroquinate dehydratase (3-dehydroquinase), partial [Spiromyces aspiralis]
YIVESDASSATYPLAIAAITGTTCHIPSLGSASLQGDARFAVDVLRPMGCEVSQTESATTVTGPPLGQLRPLPSIDMEPMTDAFLTAAVLAAVAQDPAGQDHWTRITGIANQHVKECDRIHAMVTELAKFGVEAENLPDGINIKGVKVSDLRTPDLAGIHCYDDHRVAMSFSVLSTVTPGGAVIQDRHCVEKTWPQWWDTLANTFFVTLAGHDLPTQLAEADEGHAAAAGKNGSGEHRSVVIIGMRGVGKTSQGTAASKALGWGFIDVDHYIGKKLGRTASDVIKQDGWDAFRAHEVECLNEIIRNHPTNTIIACGGGIVESQQPREVLKRHIEAGGPVIALYPNIEKVRTFLEAEQSRPAYVGESIHDVFSRRKPLYRECSNYVLLVDSDNEEDSWDDMAAVWPKIEADFIRLVEFVSGANTNHVHLADRDLTTFVSLTAPDLRALGADKLTEITIGANAVELRVDLLLNADNFAGQNIGDSKVFERFTEYVIRQVAVLRRYVPGLPVIYTVRTTDQGGAFPASQHQARMFELLELGLRLGCEYVDIEMGWDPVATERVVQRKGNSLIIASYHDVTGSRLRWDATEFGSEQLRLARRYGGITKLISVAHSWQDNELCMDFAKRNHSAEAPLIALNMGYEGQITRILCPCLTPITHPALATKAAKGQLTLAEIHKARNLMSLLPAREFYLFGTPIQHSPSPAMHNTAFTKLGLPHRYSLFESATVESLNKVIRDPSFGGASVTIPHKIDIIPLLDELTPAARKIGAVNTIIPLRGADSCSARRLIGDNTDYLGIVRSVKRAASSVGLDFRNNAGL